MKKFIAHLFVCYLFGSSLALALPGELCVVSLSEAKKAWDISVSKAGSEDALMSKIEDALYELTGVTRVECDMQSKMLKIWIIDVRKPFEQIINDAETKLKKEFGLDVTIQPAE